MIYYNSKQKKQIRNKVDKLVGKPFDFIERMKLGGNSSSRLEVIGISHHLSDFFEADLDDSRLTIQLRKRGIVVHVENKDSKYLWPVPYYRLSLYQSHFFSIHAEGRYIRIDKDSMVVNNRRFMQKLVELRAAFLESPT